MESFKTTKTVETVGVRPEHPKTKGTLLTTEGAGVGLAVIATAVIGISATKKGIEQFLTIIDRKVGGLE